jgi:hypothetical protein
MHRTTTRRTAARAILAAALLATLGLAACSTGSPAPTDPPVTTPSPAPPTEAPIASPSADPGGGEPLPGQPQLVEPKPGQRNLRAVAVDRLETRFAADGRLIVTAFFWSGVEPCNVLDSVVATRDGSTITLTLREGSGDPPDAVCIEIGVYKATEIDLGRPDPGEYRITADPATGAVEVTVQVT